MSVLVGSSSPPKTVTVKDDSPSVPRYSKLTSNTITQFNLTSAQNSNSNSSQSASNDKAKPDDPKPLASPATAGTAANNQSMDGNSTVNGTQQYGRYGQGGYGYRRRGYYHGAGRGAPADEVYEEEDDGDDSDRRGYGRGRRTNRWSNNQAAAEDEEVKLSSSYGLSALILLTDQFVGQKFPQSTNIENMIT